MKFLIDPGHSGLAFGHYMTAGKRSPEIPPGLYEGEVNRKICKEILDRHHEGYEVLNINPGPINIPLGARVKFINQLVKRLAPEPVALIDIHCNAAAKRGWSSANGFVVFKPRWRPWGGLRREQSATLARMLHKHYTGFGFYDRGIKQAGFKMIRAPKCPSVLLEMGFMTNKTDAQKLQDPMTQIRIAERISDTMAEFTEYMRR